MFRTRKIIKIVVHDAENIRILHCVKEQKLTEKEIERKYNLMYPHCISVSKSFGGYVREKISKIVSDIPEVNINKVILSCVEKGLLRIEIVGGERKKESFFYLTPEGRGLIVKKEKEKGKT